MIACPRCHRLRTPTGLHICLEKAVAVRGLTVASAPPSGPRFESRRLDGPRAISSFMLPGGGPAALVWNALVEGR